MLAGVSPIYMRNPGPETQELLLQQKHTTSEKLLQITNSMEIYILHTECLTGTTKSMLFNKPHEVKLNHLTWIARRKNYNSLWRNLRLNRTNLKVKTYTGEFLQSSEAANVEIYEGQKSRVTIYALPLHVDVIFGKD